MSRSDYFDSYDTCHKHGQKNCIGCRNAHKKEERDIKSKEFSLAVLSAPLQSEMDERSYKKQIEISDMFHKQTDMIKTVLKLDKKGLESIKVKDIPAMMEKVQDEATVGHMKKMLSPRPSFLEKLLFRKAK